MTVPIFSGHTAVRSPHQAKPLQSFDVRCDWLSLIYRGLGSVNFKLTDKKSTATIRTHRFFLSLSNVGGARLSTENGNKHSSSRPCVFVGGRREISGSSFLLLLLLLGRLLVDTWIYIQVTTLFYLLSCCSHIIENG